MTQRVLYKKLRPEAVCPTYQSADAAGADLCAALPAPVTVQPGETAFVPTGLSLEIPQGFVGLVCARSGLACKKGLAPANKVGVIDADFRGELMVALFNHAQQAVQVLPGERVAQLLLVPYLTAEFSESTLLSETARGAGGFGSTGK